MEHSPPHPGFLIRDVRVSRGLTQHQLAIRAGTTQAAISRLERGERSPSIGTLERLLLVMGAQLELSTSHPAGATHDADEIRRGRALSIQDRLARACAWNSFAASIAGAAKPSNPDEHR